MYRNIKNIDSGFVRDVNTNLVLNMIRKKKVISRSVLARLTSLSYPTVSTIVKQLMKEGLVQEDQVGKFSGGRKPMLLKFNPESRQVIGLDLSGSKAQAVLADLNGDFLSEVVIGDEINTNVDLVEIAVGVIDELQRRTGFSKQTVVGIGASLRGSFDLPNKLFYYAENESAPVKLLDGLEEHYHLPIVMDHISTVALLAEKMHGGAINAQNVAYVNVSRGVSAGLMINGEIYRGVLGNAGEFGHVLIDPEGEVCASCGRRGCLENIASLHGVLKTAQRKGYPVREDLPYYEQIRALGEAAMNGDELAQACFDDAINGLAEGLTDLVNILNLELVILGGKIIQAYPPFVEKVAKKVLDQCWQFSRQRLSIIPASSAEHRLLQGAVSMILEEVFASYAINNSSTGDEIGDGV